MIFIKQYNYLQMKLVKVFCVIIILVNREMEKEGIGGMGKIYFNLSNKEFNYLEENEVCKHDMLLSDMVGKIVLVSINSVVTFSKHDLYRSNKNQIQKLLENGYKAANSDMEFFITQAYNICPICGKDIDIFEKSNTVIYDVGWKLSNIADRNICPAKELKCPVCNYVGLYYYDIYANKDERDSFALKCAKEGSRVYIRFLFEVDTQRKASIPIIFDFKQFLSFFNKNSKDKSNKSNDIFDSLRKSNSNELVKLLFNEELQKLLETDENKLLNNMRVDLKPIKLVSYSKYKTKNDYELIKSYENISKNKEKLKGIILSK